jgi:hypothetical protein
MRIMHPLPALKLSMVFSPTSRDQVVVPVDKTNSFRLVDSKDDIRLLKAHLNDLAKKVSRHHLMDVLQSGQDLLGEMEGMVGEKEVEFVKQSLLSKQIPTPSLLITDHKKPCSTTGEHPTCLIVPAQIFTFSLLDV